MRISALGFRARPVAARTLPVTVRAAAGETLLQRARMGTRLESPHSHMSVLMTPQALDRILGKQRIPGNDNSRPKHAHIEKFKMPAGKSGMAVFDVDKNLYDGEFGYDFHQMLLGMGLQLFGSRRVYTPYSHLRNWPRYIWAKHKTENFLTYNELGVQTMWGMRESRAQFLAQQFLERVVLSPSFNDISGPVLYPEAQAVLRGHQAEKLATAVATASNFYGIEALTRHLGIDFVIANRPIVNSRGVITYKVERPLVVHVGKTVLVHQMLDVLKIPHGDAYFYSDDPVLDQDTFQHVGTNHRRFVTNFPWRYQALVAELGLPIYRFDGQRTAQDARSDAEQARIKSARKRVIGEAAAGLRRDESRTSIVKP